MSRLLPAVALLAVAACAPPLPDGPPPPDLRERYAAAIDAGDAVSALAVVRGAAREGHLLALADLARIYERGYIATFRDGGPDHLPVRTFPWSAPLAQRRLAQAVRARAPLGDPEALFLVAEEMLAREKVAGEWRLPPARRDSAGAVYAALVAADADPVRLAFLARRLDDDDGYRAHLRAAADAGDAQACRFLLWAEKDRDALFTAAALAADLDGLAACDDPDAPAADGFAASAVSDLAAQSRAGNGAATATLDSLRALGVFERHPSLASAI